MVIHNGHQLASSLASRNFSTTRALSETWSGVHQLQAVKRISEGLDKKKLTAISRDLDAIGKTLFTRSNFQMALIGEEAVLADAQSAAASLRDGFAPGGQDGFRAPDVTVEGAVIREGWSTSSAVSFVALAFESVRMQHADAAALAVISKLLRSLYLHREIRERGGLTAGLPFTIPKTACFVLRLTVIPIWQEPWRFLGPPPALSARAVSAKRMSTRLFCRCAPKSTNPTLPDRRRAKPFTAKLLRCPTICASSSKPGCCI
jgi:hypothetical protein